MNSPYDAGQSYPSFHGNFIGRDGLEGMINNGAHQYNTSSGTAGSPQIESHQDWVFQKIKDLIAAKANIEAELREYQDLYYKRQYARAQQITHMPYTPTTTTTTTTTPDVPFMPISPYSTTSVSPHSSQGETWNIPNHIPPPSMSQLSTAGTYAQPATHRLPRYTVLNRAGKKIFRCECEHEASREGDMKRHRQSLGHAKKSYICPICLESYTRKDSLVRHAKRKLHF